MIIIHNPWLGCGQWAANTEYLQKISSHFRWKRQRNSKPINLYLELKYFRKYSELFCNSLFSDIVVFLILCLASVENCQPSGPLGKIFTEGLLDQQAVEERNQVKRKRENRSVPFFFEDFERRKRGKGSSPRDDFFKILKEMHIYPNISPRHPKSS